MRLVKIILNLAKKMKKELLSSTKRATIFDIIRASFMVSRATFFDKKSYFFIVTRFARGEFTSCLDTQSDLGHFNLFS